MPKGIYIRTKESHMKKKEYREFISKQNTKHGDARHNKQAKLYLIWASMKARCYNTFTERYKFYGGKGIRVCKEWENDYRIFKKWALDSGYENGLTIHRVDKDKNYNSNNCIIITKKEHNQFNMPPHKLKISDTQIKKILDLFTEGITRKHIANVFTISIHTVYQILNGRGCPRYKRIYKEKYEKS